MDTETLTEQIRKIIAQGMAARIPSIYTAREIVEIIVELLEETEEEGK